jgi:hypothetical protein
MKGKFVLTLVLLFVLIGAVPAIVSANLSVGVKAGDWIEYDVTFTGTPDQLYSVAWFRMEIVSVQGNLIDVAITQRFINGTVQPYNVTINLETGQLGDDLIIPANLNNGDKFFDINVGNITISGAEERNIAGATRTVLSGSTSQTSFYWDRSTGVRVKSISTEPNFNLTVTVSKTNLWEPQLFGLNPVVFYAIVIVVVAIIAIAVLIAILVTRRKK